MTHPERLAELDSLATEFFGTHRYGSMLARLLGITPSAVNQWSKSTKMPEAALVAMRFAVRAKRAETARARVDAAIAELRGAADLLAGDHPGPEGLEARKETGL